MAFVDFDQRLVQNGNLIPTLVEGDIILLSVRAGAYFGLNRTGTRIWNMLAEPRNIGQILDSLARLYAVSPDDLERDVEPFLRSLVKQDVLRVVDEDARR